MKLFKYSGQPIEFDHIKKKRDELDSKMDLLESSLGKCTRENSMHFEKAFEEFDEDLQDKYPLMVEVEYPESDDEMKAFNEEWGTVAFCQEDGQTVCYILDTGETSSK